MHATRLLKLIISALLFAGLSLCAFGQEAVVHGNGALEIFDAEGQANSPRWVMGWVAFMLTSFLIGIGFAFVRKEARWLMAPIVLGFVSMFTLFAATDLPQLSGLIALIHLIFWTPTLIMLLRNRWFLKESTWFGRWTGVLTFVILFSFIFDIRDAAIYLDHFAGLGLF